MTQEKLKVYARRLASVAEPGDVIELVGDVGAGKTTFAKAFIASMDVKEHVHSPTFTISNVYESGKARIVHYDFYRLNDPGVMRNELESTVDAMDSIVLIEWAAIIEDTLPLDRITIELTPVAEDVRRVEINASGKRGTRLAEAWS